MEEVGDRTVDDFLWANGLKFVNYAPSRMKKLLEVHKTEAAVYDNVGRLFVTRNSGSGGYGARAHMLDKRRAVAASPRLQGMRDVAIRGDEEQFWEIKQDPLGPPLFGAVHMQTLATATANLEQLRRFAALKEALIESAAPGAAAVKILAMDSEGTGESLDQFALGESSALFASTRTPPLPMSAGLSAGCMCYIAGCVAVERTAGKGLREGGVRVLMHLRGNLGLRGVAYIRDWLRQHIDPEEYKGLIVWGHYDDYLYKPSSPLLFDKTIKGDMALRSVRKARTGNAWDDINIPKKLCAPPALPRLLAQDRFCFVALF